MEKEEEKTQDEMINELVDKIVQNKEIKNIFDAQEILKKSFGKVIEGMLEAEISTQLGHKKYEYTEKPKTNYRNGHSKKTVKSSMGEIELDIPRDINNEYEPIVLPKNSRNISDLETQIIKLYGMGNSTREISAFVEELYVFNISAEMISNITDKIILEMEEWKSRSLDSIYPFVFIDAIHFNVRANGVVGKKQHM